MKNGDQREWPDEDDFDDLSSRAETSDEWGQRRAEEEIPTGAYANGAGRSTHRRVPILSFAQASQPLLDYVDLVEDILLMGQSSVAFGAGGGKTFLMCDMRHGPAHRARLAVV